MYTYKNLSGNSNVSSFEVGDSWIIVTFKGHGKITHYLYTYESAGESEVEKMKRLAFSGRGLGSMLATKPYHSYERKW